MQRLRNFPFSGAFQRATRASDGPTPPKEGQPPTQAKALWPDNKAILPEAPPRPEKAPSEKREAKAKKNNVRAPRPPAKTDKQERRLPPAPPLDAMPPFGTSLDAPLSIQPSFNLNPPTQETKNSEEETLLLSAPLTITPRFAPPAPPSLSIQPQMMGQNDRVPPTEDSLPAIDSALLVQLRDALTANLSTMRDVRAQLAQQCVELALAAARSIAGHAIAADSLQILRARLPELLLPQSDAPTLHINICPQDLEAARQLVQSLALAQGFNDDYLIEADPRLEPGDASVKWRQYGWRSLVSERRASVEASVQRMLTQIDESDLPTSDVKTAPHG